MSSEVEGEEWPVRAGKTNIVSKIQDFAVALISDRMTYTVHLSLLIQQEKLEQPVIKMSTLQVIELIDDTEAIVWFFPF